MEPRIQYMKTEDGASIAYWTLGEILVPDIVRGLARTSAGVEFETGASTS